MSLYAEYLKERTDDLILEEPTGFATYRYLGTSVYIIDIYTVKESRNSGMAAAMADKIVAEAKEKGCNELLGTVIPTAKGSSVSMDVLRAYGMKLKSSENNLIIFRKDI